MVFVVKVLLMKLVNRNKLLYQFYFIFVKIGYCYFFSCCYFSFCSLFNINLLSLFYMLGFMLGVGNRNMNEILCLFQNKLWFIEKDRYENKFIKIIVMRV